MTALFVGMTIFKSVVSGSGYAACSSRCTCPVNPVTRTTIDSANQKDIFDVISNWLKLKSQKPKNETPKPYVPYYSILPGVGLSLQNGWIGVVSANVSYYTDTAARRNISAISLEANYTQKRQFYLPITTSLWTKGNKYTFQGDWRYYYYPSLTYGIGGHTMPSNAEYIKYSYIRFYETAMKNVLPDFLMGLGYNFDYHWNIASDQAGSGASNFKEYNTSPQSISSGVSLVALYDTRRNSNNPLPGYYLNGVFRVNSQAIGSTSNWTSLLLDLRKYIALPRSSRNILAFWSYNWLTLRGNPPYFDLPSTGWDTYENTGRGYIQGRFRGKNLIYGEMEYRMVFTRNGLLGGALFVNGESVSNWPRNNFDAVHPAAGFGLRLKVNKKSNLNIAIDYGFGENGSNGVCINLGEVF
jgi:outer membrane protein assembly factor BamA